MITLENDNIGKEEREREKGKTYLSVDKRPKKGRENLGGGSTKNKNIVERDKKEVRGRVSFSSH